MKKLNKIIIVFAIFLTACLNTKYPTGTRKYEGVVMACRADSNTIIKDTLIKIKKAYYQSLKKCPTCSYCPNCKYKDCDNKPDYFDFAINWPGNFIIDFKKKEYTFLHNSSPAYPNIKVGEKGYGIHYDLDYGTILFSKRTKTIILVSKKYNVARNFTYNYSKKDSVLILRELRGF